MTLQSTEEKVKASLKRVLGKKVKKISSVNKLVEDLGLDSFSALELIYDLEDTLGIKISDEQAKQFITVQDVIDFFNKTALPKGGR